MVRSCNVFSAPENIRFDFDESLHTAVGVDSGVKCRLLILLHSYSNHCKVSSI